MTQEEKQLVIKDLSARLPYGVMVLVKGEKYFNEIKEPYIVTLSFGTYLFDDEDITLVPYLRPMSSMTTKERRFLLKFGTVGMDENDKVFDVYPYGMERTMSVIDFLNAHHFDYRELIPMGLALEAPEGMYKENV